MLLPNWQPTVWLQLCRLMRLQNTAVYAPITFEEIVIAMINKVIRLSLFLLLLLLSLLSLLLLLLLLFIPHHNNVQCTRETHTSLCRFLMWCSFADKDVWRTEMCSCWFAWWAFKVSSLVSDAVNAASFLPRSTFSDSILNQKVNNNKYTYIIYWVESQLLVTPLQKKLAWE